MFHQSKWSRTVDLNTTHVVPFKSPRDVEQIDQFGRHLNNSEFIQDCYQEANFVFKWSVFDWFRSKDKWIVAVLFQYHRARSYNFLYNLLFLQKRPLWQMKEKNTHIMKHWQYKKNFKRILCNCSADEIKFLCEFALNIINENIPCKVDSYSPMKKSWKYYAMLRHVTKQTNSYLQQRDQIDAGDQFSCLLISNTMSS